LEIYQFIDEVIEMRDIDELNELLKNGYVLINTFTSTSHDGDNNETLHYSVGRVNMNRNLTERKN